METKTEIEGVTLTTDFTQEDIDYSIKRHAEIFDGEYGFKPFFNDMVAKLIGDFPSIYKACDNCDVSRNSYLVRNNFSEC